PGGRAPPHLRRVRPAYPRLAHQRLDGPAVLARAAAVHDREGRQRDPRLRTHSAVRVFRPGRRRCFPAPGGTVLCPPLPRTSAAGVALCQLAAGPPTGRGSPAVVEYRGLRPALATHRGGETR